MALSYLDAIFVKQWSVMDDTDGHPDRYICQALIFLWGDLKSIIHETSVESIKDIVARLSFAAAKERETPGIFCFTRELLFRRC